MVESLTIIILWPIKLKIEGHCKTHKRIVPTERLYLLKVFLTWHNAVIYRESLPFGLVVYGGPEMANAVIVHFAILSRTVRYVELTRSAG